MTIKSVMTEFGYDNEVSDGNRNETTLQGVVSVCSLFVASLGYPRTCLWGTGDCLQSRPKWPTYSSHFPLRSDGDFNVKLELVISRNVSPIVIQRDISFPSKACALHVVGQTYCDRRYPKRWRKSWSQRHVSCLLAVTSELLSQIMKCRSYNY